jgi:uncharacterized Fe-S cluster-containing MiaB family protein
MTLADFDGAASALARHGIHLRVFVLVGVPFVLSEEQVEWAVRSACHAAAQGARHVALIPVRPGNGALDRLAATGGFSPPHFADLEAALERSLAVVSGSVVTADLWGSQRLSNCPGCRSVRLARLARMNLTGAVELRASCTMCWLRE